MNIFLNYLKRFRIAIIFAQILTGIRVNIPRLKLFIQWMLRSREISTYTYKLNPLSRNYLIQTVALVTSEPLPLIEQYFLEIESNLELHQRIIDLLKASEDRYKKDLRCDFGSRVAWYAIIRALKLKVVVENGVEQGLTAVVLNEAILKNASEGFAGRYIGIDINSAAGYLVRDVCYSGFSQFIVDDALSAINQLDCEIDFYFSDGCRTVEYESREFNVLRQKLSAK
jgi:ubiquinone biosynthesis protein UbiJ